MLCYELHEETAGCRQEISQAAGWKYCPVCGRLNAHLNTPDGALRVNGANAVQTVALRNTGFTSLQASATVLEGKDRLEIIGGDGVRVMVPQRAVTPIELRLSGASHSTKSFGTIVIQADDGLREPSADPWEKAELRKIPVRVSVDVPLPAQLTNAQHILLFRDSIRERKVRLTNPSSRPVEVLEARSSTDNIEVIPSRASVPPEGSLEFTVKCRYGSNTPEHSELSFMFGDTGTRIAIPVRCSPTAGIERVPYAIIGIDFGTAFTTVAVREYLDDPHREDPVNFLKLAGEAVPERFPTRVYVGPDGRFQFASRASEAFKDDPSGFIFREIKTQLRAQSPDPALIHPRPHAERAVGAMRDRYGTDWVIGLVSEYLRWLYQKLILPELEARFGANSYVRYVFTLPVLDFRPGEDSPQYDRQRSRMEQCIDKAGFPVDCVEFQFEPVAAAMGFIHPKDNQWKKIGTQDAPLRTGEYIAIFDSGGGTTDVVLMAADMDEDKVKLDVQRCLGVGSKTETFGGEMVTDGMLRAFEDPRSVESDPRFPWLTGSWNIEKAFSELNISTVEGKPEFREIELRDHVESIKKSLIVRDPYEANGVEINSNLLLHIVRNSLASLNEALPAQVFDQVNESSVQYYICVGGNTYLPIFNRWVQEQMSDYNDKRRLSFPDTFRTTAVAFGATWVWDARMRNAVPYGLAVTAADTVLIQLHPNSSEEMLPRQERLSLPPSAQMQCAITATIDGVPYQVDAGTVNNPYETRTFVYLQTSVQNGHVDVKYSLVEPKNFAPLLQYRL